MVPVPVRLPNDVVRLGHLWLQRRAVEAVAGVRIHRPRGRLEQVGPQRYRVRLHLFRSFPLSIAEKSSVPVRCHVIDEPEQQICRPLERCGVLLQQLEHALQPLEKDRAVLAGGAFAKGESCTKLMAERTPLFLYQAEEARDGSVLGVEAEHRQRRGLRRTIPSIRTVYHNVAPLVYDFLDDFECAVHDGANVIIPGRVGNVLEPRTHLAIRDGSNCVTHCAPPFAHGMDVVDTAEHKAATFVSFEATAASFVNPS
mmetsp:Transcript_21056/g.56119  ORF Transcript_21056/g.56119 Transcript_21056/m.56119 type:complete len:256 (-) Transcript_21056:1278-2045(-)